MNQTEINIYDKLLYYLSHVGELRWEKFKDATSRLTDNQQRFNPSTYLQSLGRLGHLDYDPIELTRVVITPAALIDTAVENRYVLVGSRTPAFLEEIKNCVADTGGEWHTKFNKYAPTTFVLSNLTDASFAKIENLGIHIGRAFSAKLSEFLPKPKHTDFPQQTEMSFPDSLKKFNLRTLEYEPDNLRHGNGLYEIPQYGPSVYILKSGSDQRRVPRDWGVWLAFSALGRTTGWVSYVEKAQTWCVAIPLQVPLIIDRCATLCSGFPPKLKRNFYHYSDVPIGVAYQLTKSLYQDWEVI
ncbi:MAG: hypothetical protein OXI61_01910 [Candidatus Poribacteria bacterium]|nr:hypothetical protein [Candidatus Poribacteria bacterium]